MRSIASTEKVFSLRAGVCCWSVVALLAAGTLGCAGYSMTAVREDLLDGRVESAFLRLERAGRETLPDLLEYGLVAHYAGHYPESVAAFERAKELADAAYTRSLSREVTALWTSDTARTYTPTRYERLMIHFYEALDYLALGLPDDALVEARQASRLLLHYADVDPTFQFAGAAFVAYFAGVLYEWAGEWNDAFVAYRWAEEAYRRAAENGGPRAPTDLGAALVRLADRLGLSEESWLYRQRYGDSAGPPDGWGELILFHEAGFAPRKVETNLFLPVLKSDRIERESEVWLWADRLVRRARVVHMEGEIEYLIRVALPVLRPNPPRYGGARLRYGGSVYFPRLVEDLSWAMEQTFVREQQAILLRATARALLKYLAYRRVRKVGWLAGVAFQAFALGTERADTRSWQTLPARIYALRVPLPAGVHDLELHLPSRRGGPGQRLVLHDVSIQAGQLTIRNLRTFP